MQILIVDDHTKMRRIIREQLVALGYSNVLEAEDGESALPILDSMAVALVITDLSMPRLNGIELTRHVRGNERFRDTRVVMISVDSSSEQIERATAAGADCYIVKPFTAETLDEKIADVFRRVAEAR